MLEFARVLQTLKSRVSQNSTFLITFDSLNPSAGTLLKEITRPGLYKLQLYSYTKDTHHRHNLSCYTLPSPQTLFPVEQEKINTVILVLLDIYFN